MAIGTKKQEIRQVGRKETLAYGLGDLGFQLAWGTMGAFLTFFQTDILGVLPASLILLGIITRIWDGTNDVMMGLYADRSKVTKYGKYTKFIRWGAIPLGIMTVLMFTAPGFLTAYWMKVAWAYVTYIFADAMFTIVNLPYNALLPSITSDFQERTRLTSTRIAIMLCGAILVNAATRPLFIMFGGGTSAAQMGKGMFLTVTLYMVIAVPLLLFCAANCKERVDVGSNADQKVPIKKSLKAMTFPWVLLVIMNFCLWVGNTTRNGTAIYYLTYVIKKPGLVSLVIPICLVMALPTILLAPKMTRWFNSKRWPIIIGNLVAIVGSALMWFAHDNTSLLIAGCVLAGLGFGPQGALTYAMIADTVDYGEWKNGVRAQGFLYSAASFGVKAGTAVGAVIISVMLTIGGYIAGAEQTRAAMDAISIGFILVPIICFVIICVALLFYRLDGNSFNKIREELIIMRGVSAPAEVDEITKFEGLNTY